MPPLEKLSPMSDQLPVDYSLFFKLIKVVNLTAQPFQALAGEPYQLTLNEWRAMVVLASQPGCNATDIVESTGLDKMSVSRAIHGLEKHGRVRKTADLLDQRKAKLSLTADAKRLYAKIGAQAKQREITLFSGLKDQEMQQLGTTLDKIILALSSSETKEV